MGDLAIRPVELGIMTTRGLLVLLLLPLIAFGCVERQTGDEPGDVKGTSTTATVIQTSRGGDKLAEIATLELTAASGSVGRANAIRKTIHESSVPSWLSSRIFRRP